MFLYVYETPSGVAMSAVMQNAMLGNPLAGETKPWRSR